MTNTITATEFTARVADLVEAAKGLDLRNVESANLVPLAKALQSLAAFGTPVHGEIETRAIGNGELIPGAVTKPGVVHRKWHDQDAAEQLAREQFGDAAFTVALKSPAQIEKLDGGATFVAVASYKPEAALKVVY